MFENIETKYIRIRQRLLKTDVCVCVSQDHLAALMEVNEENETLMKQYDREKQRRKEIEEVKYTCI